MTHTHTRLLGKLVCLLLLAACQKAEVPATYTQGKAAPTYPDYAGVTVPANLAPLTWHIDLDAEEYVTRLSEGDVEVIIGGQDVCPKPKQWARFAQQITVDTYTRSGQQWTRHTAWTITISPDPIDPYIAYRLIAPSYVTYEDLTICQRNLTNYKESVVYSNMINSNEQDGQCINCHSFQSWNPQRMQFHVRQAKGGTLIARDGQLTKVDMKTGKTVSAGVYPAWHPTLPLIAYSTNQTGQSFHTCDNQKIEVQDSYSDLMLYDIEANEVLPLEADTAWLDCFPHWSPDGKWLYYCSAHYQTIDTMPDVTRNFDMIMHYQDIRYSLYRRSFDADTKQFGQRETVYDAAADSMSATLPRVSPDGRWLMFAMGDYGVFHIWHKSADLYMIDLTSGEMRRLDELNSPDVESYHSWSSSGRWVIFSSRRSDGNFTRPYLAHANGDGTFTKPVELPCRNPQHHRQLMRSYNIPEFITGPVTVRPQDLARAIKDNPIKAK